MKKILFLAAAVPLMAGCEDLDAALITMGDELSYADGAYFRDSRHSQEVEGDCPAVWEYGHASNQSYVRVINHGDTDASVDITWSAGSKSSFYLEPGETSDYEYRSGSITPDYIDIEC